MANLNVSSRATRALIAGLHQVRLQQDLTYDEMAPLVGISRRALFRIMNDKRGSVHDRTMQKVRVYLAKQPSGATEAAS
jgi:transcriptional regulator GlxA family with amidase domain